MKRFFSIAILLYLVSTATFAQKWSVEQCIDYAIRNNVQIKQSDANVEISRLNRSQAKFDYLPSINASSGYSMSSGRTPNPVTYQITDNLTTNNFNSSISVSTQLFAGMTKMYALEKSKLDLLASIQDVEVLKYNITISVAAAYLQILYNKEQIEVAQNQIEVVSEQLKRVKQLVEAGSVSLGDQLEMDAQLAKERYNLVTHENNLRTSFLIMTQLLELKDSQGFDIIEPNMEQYFQEKSINSVDDINNQAQGLPQIKTRELRLKMAEVDVKMAQARYYPTISASYSYGTGYSDQRTRTVLGSDGKPITDPSGGFLTESYPFWDQYKDFRSSSVGVNMQIPIFNGLTTRRNVSIARVGVLNNDHSLTIARNDLYKEIQQAHNDATGALNSYYAADANVQNTLESFRYAQERFIHGAANSIDYITAKNNLISAESALLQAKYEHLFRIKILDFYTGIPIRL